MTCRVVCGCQLTDAFQVNTEMRQGCLLLPCLFLLAIEWMLTTSTTQRGNGIQWTHSLDPSWWLGLGRWPGSPLPYPATDASDDQHSCGWFSLSWSEGPQGKEQGPQEQCSSQRAWLENVTSFTFLGSIVDKQGRTDVEVKVRTGRVRTAFLQMKNILA